MKLYYSLSSTFKALTHCAICNVQTFWLHSGMDRTSKDNQKSCFVNPTESAKPYELNNSLKKTRYYYA